MKDNVCIVTGAGSGIGRAIAVRLAGMGATVVLVGRTKAKLDAAAAEIESEAGAVVVEPCDVTDYDAVRQLAKLTADRYGRIDVLVNNAGFSSRNRTTLTVTRQEAEDVVRVNLLAPFFLTQAVLPTMLAAEKGTIVNISSTAGQGGGRLSGPVYGPAKAGLINFTRFLNVELRNSGVRACVVLPGEVDTPIMENRPVPPSAEARSTMIAAEDIADAAVLAVAAHPRALVEEIVVKAGHQRDYSAELMPPF